MKVEWARLLFGAVPFLSLGEQRPQGAALGVALIARSLVLSMFYEYVDDGSRHRQHNHNQYYQSRYIHNTANAMP
jgi:hypothetical protein